MFDPHTLLGRVVFVDNVPGKDRKLRTREGLIKGVIETAPPTIFKAATHDLEISLFAGTAEPNQMVTVPYESKEWRLRFPDKTEKKA